MRAILGLHLRCFGHRSALGVIIADCAAFDQTPPNLRIMTIQTRFQKERAEHG